MQVLRFDKQQPYDHFVQVNGYPAGEQNDFSAGDHTGLLKHRPSRYVPVKVSLYNEQGNVQELKLLNSTHPVISRSDDLVEVLFKLMGSEYNRITR